MMRNILAITNEPELVRTLRRDLENAGCRLVNTGDAQTALNLMRHERPDLVLLDLASPFPELGQGHARDGLEICQQLRQNGDVPIIVLTDCLEEAERLVAQEASADDFVLKPFHPRQVVARARTLLRWAERQDAENPDVIRFGALELSPAYHRATVAGKPVHLTRTEFDLLAALAAQPGRAFTRSQLIGALSTHRGISARGIDSHIKNLRAKIEPVLHHPSYILTVYGVGYKLNA